jgi:hypothetical protein
MVFARSLASWCASAVRRRSSSLLTGLVDPDDAPFNALVVPPYGQELEGTDAARRRPLSTRTNLQTPVPAARPGSPVTSGSLTFGWKRPGQRRGSASAHPTDTAIMPTPGLPRRGRPA